MEIGIPVGIAIILISIYLYNKFKNRKSRPFEWVHDPEINVSRNPVYVGQRTDVRFLFTIVDLRRRRSGRLYYTAELYIEGSRVAQRTADVTQQSLRTSLPYLGASWSAPGAKAVKGEVKLFLETGALFSSDPNRRISWPADDMSVEDVVNVIIKEEDMETDH